MPTQRLGQLARWLHGSYLFGLGMQALIGSTQLLAALILLFAQATDEMKELAHWTGRMLATQTPDPFAASLLRDLHDFSVHPHTFWSIYLVGHGLLNLGVVFALLAKKHWAHPVSIGVLTVFIVYQLSRYAIEHSPVLIFLSIFDVVVIGLVWNEWKTLKAQREG